MYRKVILYKKTDDECLIEECIYRQTEKITHPIQLKQQIFTYEVSKKINKNYAKLCMMKVLKEHRVYYKDALLECKNLYSVSFAFGDKKTVNKFIFGDGDYFNGKTNFGISSMIFAIKAIKVMIDMLKDKNEDFGIIVCASDKRRFSAYRRLEKLGFKKSGVDFSNTFCYYYYIHK